MVEATGVITSYSIHYTKLYDLGIIVRAEGKTDEEINTRLDGLEIDVVARVEEVGALLLCIAQNGVGEALAGKCVLEIGERIGEQLLGGGQLLERRVDSYNFV